MLLSTQLIRGAIALPMLLVFAALGLMAEAPTPRAVPVASSGLLPELCRLAVPPSRVLVLAQAPADLGRLAIRWQAPCRA